MKNCKSILELSTQFLSQHQIPRPRFIAETLLAHFLQKERIELYMHFDRPLVEEELVPFRAALKRVIKGEPVDYVLGEVEFFGTKIKVTSDVLIPRPETEILLDLICKRLDGAENRALDLCTGSGCLAAGLKRAKPDMEVVGVDLSEAALNVAMGNGPDVTWLQGDLTEPVKGEKFDLVICNPPYVTEAEYDQLDPSVRDFEPKMALVSGATGYEFYERLNNELPTILNPGAKVFFEIGTGQGEGLSKIFSDDPWEHQLVEEDWSGHTRFFSLNIKQNSPIMQ
ncbi:MAG: peptide chain release factor N(5)-glutamine methyltransferase [Simkaniaceae bacterium]|nr:peptide chain release factor N(5)-glutamine methyltransferase [Candidatus Sacchlamyda saccharinae]